MERQVKKRVPELEKGVNVVEADEKVPALQMLIARELELDGGEAVWIDAGNVSSTYDLAKSSREVMEKVRIGRTFTPFQHHDLVHRLEEFITPKTRILALSNPLNHYLSGQLRSEEARELFQEAWGRILEIQDRHDLKVLVTGKFSPAASNTIRIEVNDQGVRYETDGFKTEVYSKRRYVQTTIKLWETKKEDIEVEV